MRVTIVSKFPLIHLVVTDLDNTLYDWVSAFVPPFYAMVEKASEILEVDPEQLLDELKVVHQRHHNSEHPFALLETVTVQKQFPRKSRSELREILNDAFYSFNKLRKRNLKLYSGVSKTLDEIHSRGCRIVAHTEARRENILHRIKLLDLHKHKVIEQFYTSCSRLSNEDHPDPKPRSNYDGIIELVQSLPQGHNKPNPEVLRAICNDHDTPVENTLYIGDSLIKDIAMAKMAGAHSALAAYGKKFDTCNWEKLVRITHWTQEDADQEMQLKEQFQYVKPDIELCESFAEILEHFEFSQKNSTLSSRLAKTSEDTV